MENIYDIIESYLKLGGRNEGIVVEDCGRLDELLEGYYIVLPSHHIPGMTRHLTEAYPTKKKIILDAFDSGSEDSIRRHCILPPRTMGTTYTQCLLEKYGNAKQLLTVYGYLEPVEEDDIMEEVSEGNNTDLDELYKLRQELELQKSLLEAKEREVVSLKETKKSLEANVSRLQTSLEEFVLEEDEIMGEDDFMGVFEYISNLPSEEIREAVMQVCLTLAEKEDMKTLTTFSLSIFEQLQPSEV